MRSTSRIASASAGLLVGPSCFGPLARFSRPFYQALSLVLERDPEIPAKTLPIQLEGLIIRPLRTAAAALLQDLVVVIDALDECEDATVVGELLKNRSQQNIGDSKSKLILHELDESIVKEDIKLYLATELENHSVSISDPELSTLVERAGVLFIYAATVIRHIRAANPVSERQKKSKTMLSINSSGSSQTGTQIDTLYSAILDSAFDRPDLEEDEKYTMKLVLDTVVCAQEPLSVAALARLLRLEDQSAVEGALEPLWSVLHISGASHLVTMLHGSFADYMFDPKRSHTHTCEKAGHNASLAELCFDRIDTNEKKFNICGIELSYIFDEELMDLEQRVKDNIPQDLAYACRYWAEHLKLGGEPNNRFQRIDKFIKERLLLWMEVLNLKKDIHTGPLLLQTTRIWCKENHALQETQDLVHDAWRFVMMFGTNDVARSTPHLYVSMLAAWPTSGSFTGHYTQRTNGSIGVQGTGMKSRQLALLSVLKEQKEIIAIGLSSDSRRIVSGSSDSKIRVWDAQTGKALFDPFQGHTSSVNSVAFSPDGARIVSGSDDKTIRVWDAQTGRLLLGPLKGHDSRVNVVTFSPDGAQIASGSRDTTIRLWNARTGHSKTKPLQGHTNSVNSVSFSPDGLRILSASKDMTIRVWDPLTSQLLLGPVEGHTSSVNWAIFSPNGMYIVSSSKDETIRMWDAQTGKLQRDPFKGHTDSVNSVAFSPDGKHVISSSSDKTIRAWDAQTGGSLPGSLTRHTGSVNSVAFSLDGVSIVSGSDDKTIRVWDAQISNSLVEGPERQFWSFNSVVCSPDGMRIAAGLDNNAILVWDALNDKLLFEPLVGHTGSIYSVAFSPDSKHIVSGSEDATVRVWDALTGQSLFGPLEGHISAVNSVAFSPDGMRIVSGSSDDTIQLWDARTGDPVLDPLDIRKNRSVDLRRSVRIGLKHTSTLAY